MKKLAWLHAVPEGQKKSRMATLRAANDDQPSLKLPDVGEGAYIVGMVHEAGLVSSSGMGVVPLSWQEIDAWIRVTESVPQLWERLLIRELSEAYVAEFNQASEKGRESPWSPPVEEVESVRVDVAERLLSFARQFNMRRAQPAQVAQDETEPNGSQPPTSQGHI